MDMIRLEHVSKTFTSKHGSVEALKDVSLTIEKGKIFGIIGYSGGGKSTLIRCMNLLERPSAGKVWVDGEDLMTLNAKQLREKRRKMGMIFQHFNLLRQRNVFDNVAFPLKHEKLSKQQVETKVNDLLALVGLADKKYAYPSQLSGGQKQRVAIARALACDPSVLLCDEATSALDPQITHSILALLKDINRKTGITIVIITHEMAVIKEICDEVAVMENGVIVETGSIVDIFAKPKEKMTQDFVNMAASVNRIYTLIEEGNPLTELKSGETMAMLRYNADNTSQALISKISREYGVDSNIIFGNIEVLKDKPIGSLVVVFSGSSVGITHAMQCLHEKGVEVEVIRSC